MGRKDLLKGLIEGASKPDTPPAPNADMERPRYSGGAIGAVSQSIAELKSRSLAEVDAALIDAGGLTDRMGDDTTADHDALMASIRDHGQQVPVLLRPHPDKPERFQIVYGRRRVRALRALGQPVKALVRALDDRELVVAQGQENAARKDLSFIEKVNFARQMRDMDFDRKIICDALHVDKTVISRMLSVSDRIAVSLIEAIGSAPSIGRDRWLALADLMDRTETPVDTAIGLINLAEDCDSSDKRFEALMKALSIGKRRAAQFKPQAQKLQSAGGKVLGHVTQDQDKTVLTLPTRLSGGFAAWLTENLSEIHRDWHASHDEDTPEKGA